MKIKDVIEILDKFAPFKDAEHWDNVGLIVGDDNNTVTGVVLALDITNEVISYAKENNANLIITHHPVIFSPIKSINKNDIVYCLIESGIAVISSHTNLDKSIGGVNYALADSLKLCNIRPFNNRDNIGLIGDLPFKMTPDKLAVYIKQSLNSKRLSYTAGKNEIYSIAICGGAGGDYLKDAINLKIDGYLTGEVKHNIYIDAINNSYSVFTPGHHETEVLVLNYIKNYLISKSFQPRIILYEDSNIKIC